MRHLAQKSAAMFIFLMSFTLMAGSVNAQLADGKRLTAEAVDGIMAAAQAEAQANGWNVTIAVVDAGGHLLQLKRLEGANTATVDIAIGKARTSAGFGAPSQVFQNMVPNRQAFLSVSSDLVLLEGAVPITADGQVLGAVGVSGVAAENDARIAQAGVDALEQ